MEADIFFIINHIYTVNVKIRALGCLKYEKCISYFSGSRALFVNFLKIKYNSCGRKYDSCGKRY